MSTIHRRGFRSIRISALNAAFATLLLGSAAPAVAQTVFFDGFEPVVADYCDDPLVEPQGWNVFATSWSDTWSSPDGSPRATFPNSVGFPVPIGTNRGALRVIGFTMPAGMTIDLTWDPAQSNGNQGYVARPAQSMYFAVSPCAADARPLDPSGLDPFRSTACRQVGAASSMFLSTLPGSGSYVCRLQPDQLYYMTVAPVNPFDGLTPGEHSCDDSMPETQFGCDVQARHTGQ